MIHWHRFRECYSRQPGINGTDSITQWLTQNASPQNVFQRVHHATTYRRREDVQVQRGRGWRDCVHGRQRDGAKRLALPPPASSPIVHPRQREPFALSSRASSPAAHPRQREPSTSHHGVQCSDGRKTVTRAEHRVVEEARSPCQCARRDHPSKDTCGDRLLIHK